MSDPLAGPLEPGDEGRHAGRQATSSPTSDATRTRSRGDLAPARLGRRALLDLVTRLSSRERQILESVAKLRFVRSDQIRRVFFAELTTEGARTRICRRTLQGLAGSGLLRRLERRIGGTRAGSDGRVYTLSPAGRRLVAYWQGAGLPSDRGVHEPGLAFLAHALELGDLYVLLVEADRTGITELISFEAEPTREYVSAIGRQLTLRPDAFVRLGVGAYEQLSFCEIDRGTEGRGALVRKCRAYQDYHRSGREQTQYGLFPRVVWIAPGTRRARYLAELIATLPEEDRRLFAVGTRAQALTLLSGDKVEGGTP
jgi:hypothetical protein